MSTINLPEGPGLFDTVFRAYAPETETFEIELPAGERLAFQYLQGRKSLISLRNAAHRFADSVTEINCPPEMRPFMTQDHETLVWVFFLGHLSCEGEAFDFLKLQHLSPILCESIVEQVQAALTGYLDADERQRINEAKKESAPAHSGAPA